MKTENLYLFVGPSGAGKTKIQEGLRLRGYIPVKSYTTRPKRSPDEDTYRFVSEEEFFLKGMMIGAEQYQGNFYGATPDVIDEGSTYVVEPKGAHAIRKHYARRPVVVIGLTATINELERRLRERGDKEDSIKSRLEGDCTLFSCMTDLCDVVFRNERPLGEMLDEICAYIQVREQLTKARKAAAAIAAVEKAGYVLLPKPLLLPKPAMDRIIHMDGVTTFAMLITFKNSDGDMQAIPTEADYTGLHVGKHVWETDNGMFSMKPRFNHGDTLFCQEIWRPYSASSGSGGLNCEVQYEDMSIKKVPGTILAVPEKETPWRMAMTMPDEAARKRVKVTEIKPVRVQDITVEDILNMGISADMPGVCGDVNFPEGFDTWSEEKREEWVQSKARARYIGEMEYAKNLLAAFEQDWNAMYGGINAAGESYPYDKPTGPRGVLPVKTIVNPWVWLVKFEPIV